VADSHAAVGDELEPYRRPAYYALRPGGWRDLITILHPPYTAWHLSYVVFGAVAAQHLYLNRFVATLAAFLLAVGIAAHAFDEVHSRPLQTTLSNRSLYSLAAASLAGALAIGIVGVVTVTATLLPFVVVGGFLVLAYNLELWGGRFHNGFWFAAAWGAFPALTSWWINTTSIHGARELLAGGGVALGCFCDECCAAPPVISPARAAPTYRVGQLASSSWRMEQRSHCQSRC